MWVRVTCPNGHRLKIATKHLGRQNKCPVCDSMVSMWIQVVCPNGHSLKVQSKYAGKHGTCPECKLPVRVPDMTELIAMDTLKDEEGPSPIPVHQEEMHMPDSPSIVASMSTTMAVRVCPACRSKIPTSYRTCPVCNRYIGDHEQQAEALHTKSPNCPECDATSFPGDEFCRNCGMPLK